MQARGTAISAFTQLKKSCELSLLFNKKEGVQEQFPELVGNSHYEKLWYHLDRRELRDFGLTKYFNSHRLDKLKIEPDVNLAKISILEWIERAPSGRVSDLHHLYHLQCSNDESGEKIVPDHF